MIWDRSIIFTKFPTISQLYHALGCSLPSYSLSNIFLGTGYCDPGWSNICVSRWGASVRLTCSLSTGNVGGGNVPNWIYQILGSVPKLVIGSNGASNQNYRPSWTSDRFTGSITGGSAVLSISKVEVGDTGDYYCVLWANNQHT
ncbi:unnamed protein product, partial [Ranitomeya imitator]